MGTAGTQSDSMGKVFNGVVNGTVQVDNPSGLTYDIAQTAVPTVADVYPNEGQTNLALAADVTASDEAAALLREDDPSAH